MPNLNKEPNNNLSPLNEFFSKAKKEIKKKILIIGIIIALILISIIFSFYNKFANEENLIKKSSQEEKNETPSSKSDFKPVIIFSLSGVIKNINPGEIVFEANISFPDSSGKRIQEKEIRKAIVNPQTQITALTYITHKETGKILSREIEINFKDLEVGDYIEAISGENVKDQQEFLAKKIRILPGTAPK